MTNESETGGEPETFAQCTKCGHVYPAQETRDSDLRPIGTDGHCTCGNDEFITASES